MDIESIPGQAPGLLAELTAAVQAPATYKKADSIAEWLMVNRAAEGEAQWLKTSFDGGLGQVVCIGWAVDDQPAQTLSVADLSPAAEAELLSQWFAELRRVHSGGSGRRPVVVGHNHLSFDIPFVWKRAMVLGVRPPLWFEREPKPWSEHVFDTMLAWAGSRERISMDKLCRVLGIAGKGDGPTGADVWPMVQAGRLAEVASYCAADVERTRQLHLRMTFAAPPMPLPPLHATPSTSPTPCPAEAAAELPF